MTPPTQDDSSGLLHPHKMALLQRGNEVHVMDIELFLVIIQ